MPRPREGAGLEERSSMGTQLHEMYKDIEAQVMPLIKRGARRLSQRLGGHITEDDAIQAGRIVVWKSLAGYNAALSNGDIERYVQRCLRNAYLSMYARAVAKRRMPQVYEREGARYTTRPLSPIPTSMCEGLWENRVTASPTLDPELSLQRCDDVRECEMNLAEIREGLNDAQRFIMDIVIDPPRELLDLSMAMGGDPNGPPMQRAIIKWLAPLLTKNQVDNCLHMIRRAIIAHIQRGQFSDAFAARVERSWHPSGASKKYCKPDAQKRRVPVRRHAEAE